MKIFGRFINPVFAFIGIQIAWVLVVIFWVYWFMGSHRKLRMLAEKYSPDLLQGNLDWLILTEGLLLLGAILAGVYVIFIYWRRQAALYRAQRNFVAQVSHELKSPLASLQLHLETMRRRRLPPEKVQSFIEIMLADTDRLGTLVDNMLTASRLEQRGTKLFLRPVDLSEFISGYFGKQRFSLPRGGTMQIEVEPDLQAAIETEALETALRNLLENAILYSPQSPEIRVGLRAEGDFAHFTLADRGRGIEKRDQKKVFGMFQRLRLPGETIRGSGLGLFIARAVVLRHRGKIWLESAGAGRGTTVHILLPLYRNAPQQQEPAA